MRASALLAVALLAPAPARGEPVAPPAESGPVFALRAGYAAPSGDVARGGPAVSDVADRKLPLGFALGYRFGRHVWAQLGFELAPAHPAPALCAAATACEASDVHVGVELVVRLLPGRLVDPWIGVGGGAEVLNAEGRDRVTGARTEWSWAGVELPFAEAGADFALSDRIAVGPWGSLSFARFTSESTRVGGAATVSGAVHGRATHRWLAAGLQATLRL